MTETYSFQDTDALLASLSSSSVPTLSPSDIGNYSSSGKSSSYGLSPEAQNMFGIDEWEPQEDTADIKEMDNFVNFNVADQEQDEDAGDEFLNDENAIYPTESLSDASPLNFTKQDDQPYANTNSQAQNQVNTFGMPLVKTEDDSSPESHRTSPSNLSASLRGRVSKPQKKDRSSHNVIEKKYRTNINDKIGALRDAVPALRMANGDIETTIHDLDGLPPASKLNKGVILTKATEYIKHLERKNQSLFMETQQLRQILQSGGSPHSQGQTQMFQQQQSQPQQQPPQQQFGPQAQQMYQSNSQQQNMNMNQFQPASDYNGQPINMVSAQQPQYQMGMPGKVIMGGLATMVGQQMFNGDNFDYRGLSAFPILGLPQFQTFVSIVKFFFVAFSFIYIINPSLFYKTKSENDKKSDTITTSMWYELAKELVFIQVDSKKLTDASDAEINRMLNQELLSEKKASYSLMLYTLLKLHTYTPSFEVSYGKLILAKVLLTFSDLSIFINLNSVVEKSLKEISTQKVSDGSLRYFFKELQTPTGKTTESFKRFVNLISGLPLGTGCTKGKDDKGYSLILKDDKLTSDYKRLLVSFRANELFRDVLLKYIDLTFNKDNVEKLGNAEMKETKKDIWDLLNLAERLAPEKSVVQLRIKIFKSVLNEKYVDSVLKLINQEASASTETLVPETSSTETLTVDEYDDEEIFDSEAEEQQEQITERDGPTDGENDDGCVSDDSTKAPSSRRSSGQVDKRFQRILSHDLSNALTAASVLKYIRLDKRDEAQCLLRYIRAHKDEITLLSFISMFKVVQKYPKSWLAGNETETLEPLICQLRLWVGDSSNSSFDDAQDAGLKLKRDISDQLVEAGISFSEVDE